ncbi:ribonuclease H2 non-catalytic subunit-domain-containing protein [Tricladium varicosporioides]|nr:ribonuclease H2 non-catalytic subunit-domain-containing protein [Hymenoscyphus varicosporioides]
MKMHAIQKSKLHKGKCTPNVLPCRVHHNGPVNASKRYWEPRSTSDGKTIAYFRGRKLHGKQLKVPKGYRGIVLASTDKILPKESHSSSTEHEDAENEVDIKLLEEQAEFDEIMVWGHEMVPDKTTDPYVRGMEEWLTFAEQIHDAGELEKDITKRTV